MFKIRFRYFPEIKQVLPFLPDTSYRVVMSFRRSATLAQYELSKKGRTGSPLWRRGDEQGGWGKVKGF